MRGLVGTVTWASSTPIDREILGPRRFGDPAIDVGAFGSDYDQIDVKIGLEHFAAT